MKFPAVDEDGFGPDDVMRLCDVSSEAIARVQDFIAVLDIWRQRINLIGPNEGRHLWRRHILDSLQLARWIPDGANHVVDLGSGGGFPGLVLASAFADTGVSFTLVEKSPRKAEFLEAAISELELPAEVRNQRIEDGGDVLGDVRGDVVTARALAPLAKLVPMVDAWMRPDGSALLLKGSDVENELIHTRVTWSFDLVTKDSLSGPGGQLLILTSLAKRTS